MTCAVRPARGASSHAPRAGSGTIAPTTIAPSAVMAKENTPTSSAVRRRFRIRGGSSSGAICSRASALPTPNTARPSATISHRAAAGDLGMAGSGGSGAARTSAVTAPQHTATSRTATTAAIAREIVRVENQRPRRWAPQTHASTATAVAVELSEISPALTSSAPAQIASDRATYRPATAAATGPSRSRSASSVETATVAAPPPSVSRTLPKSPPRTNSARASMSTARSPVPRITAARTNQGADGPMRASATPAAKNATAPSSTRTSAAARQIEMNESRVLVARTTLTRSGTAARKRGGHMTATKSSRGFHRQRVDGSSTITRRGNSSAALKSEPRDLPLLGNF